VGWSFYVGHFGAHLSVKYVNYIRNRLTGPHGGNKVQWTSTEQGVSNGNSGKTIINVPINTTRIL